MLVSSNVAVGTLLNDENRMFMPLVRKNTVVTICVPTYIFNKFFKCQHLKSLLEIFIKNVSKNKYVLRGSFRNNFT